MKGLGWEGLVGVKGVWVGWVFCLWAGLILASTVGWRLCFAWAGSCGVGTIGMAISVSHCDVFNTKVCNDCDPTTPRPIAATSLPTSPDQVHVSATVYPYDSHRTNIRIFDKQPL